MCIIKQETGFIFSIHRSLSATAPISARMLREGMAPLPTDTWILANVSQGLAIKDRESGLSLNVVSSETPRKVLKKERNRM